MDCRVRPGNDGHVVTVVLRQIRFALRKPVVGTFAEQVR
jgi:hypothetical protein